MSSSIEVTRADVDRLYNLAFSRQMEKSAQWRELGAGALGGAGLGALLGFLTPRDEDEDKVGRYLRYILGGAALGGIAGFGYGSSKNLFGEDSDRPGGGGSGGVGGSGGNGGSNKDGRFTRWFRGRPANITSLTGIGAGAGWIAPKLLHLTGQAAHFFAPGPGASKGVKKFLGDTFSKKTFKGSNPVKWISNARKAFTKDLGYASKFVKDRVEVALARGFIPKKDYDLFYKGIKSTATPAERSEALKVMRTALSRTKGSGNWLMRNFRPGFTKKKLGDLSKLDKQWLADMYSIPTAELGRAAGGRKLLNIGGPVLGAVLGALESPENQGVIGR